MFKNLMKIAVGNLFSKGLGFLREILIAYWYGTTYFADAYRVAQTAIFLPTSLIMGNAFESAYVPNYKKSVKDNQSATFFSSVFWLMLFISTLFLVLFLLFSKPFVNALSPGFTIQAANLSISLVEVMSFGIPLYIISYIFIYTLNSNGKFGFGSVAAVVQNILFIITLSLSYFFGYFNIISYGFVFTYLLLILIVAWNVKKEGYIKLGDIRPSFVQSSIISNFSKTAWPLFIYMLLYQINIFIERSVTSNFGVGSIASIDYARTLFETPTFLAVIPLATISLPYLSGKVWEESTEYIEQVIIKLVMLLLPISVFLFVKGEAVIKVFFSRGEFNDDSVQMTYAALKGLAISLWALGLNIFLQRVYNAFFRNKEFLFISGFSLCINVLMNYYFLYFSSLKLIGVTLAYSIATIIQSVFLFFRVGFKITRTILTVILLFIICLFCGWVINMIDLSNIWFDVMVNFLLTIIICGLGYYIFPTTRVLLKFPFKKAK